MGLPGEYDPTWGCSVSTGPVWSLGSSFRVSVLGLNNDILTRSRRPLRGERQAGSLLFLPPGLWLRPLESEHERTLSLISFLLPLLITENSPISSDRLDFECERWRCLDTDFDLVRFPEEDAGTSVFSFSCRETLRLLGLAKWSVFSAIACCLPLWVGGDSSVLLLFSRLREALRPRLLGLATTASVPPNA